MVLDDIAMVAADTSRTLHYFKKLIDNNLLPNYVLLLLNSDAEMMPGQKAINTHNRLLQLLDKAGIRYGISQNKDINSTEVIAEIENRQESIFIFSGFGGVLLREKILATGKKFLHVHGGYLPDYKGSTTNYFSLIAENTIGASSIFLTKDIDCGPVLLRRKFNPPPQRNEIDHTYDSEVRANVLVETLQGYIANGCFNFELETNTGGDIFYIIHPVLKHLAILGD